MIRIGRALFILGGFLLVMVFLVNAFAVESSEEVTTKVLAVIATTLLVWFASSGKSDQEA
jgi:hypothetical protein